MSDLQNAAREHDHIAHSGSEIGGWIGAGIGAIAVGVVAVSGVFDFGATTVLAIAAGAALISKAKSWGEMIGGRFTNGSAGEIAKGAMTVFVGKEVRAQARLHDPVTCHSGAFIARASKTVIVENRNAARLHCLSSCKGTVSDACDNVFYGGPDVAAEGTLNLSESSSWLYKIFGYGLDAAGFLNPEKRIETGIWMALGMASDAIGDKKELSTVKDGISVAKDAMAIWQGKPNYLNSATDTAKLGNDANGLYGKYSAPTPEVAGQEMPPGYKP